MVKKLRGMLFLLELKGRNGEKTDVGGTQKRVGLK
jgi:hypothetical protein